MPNREQIQPGTGRQLGILLLLVLGVLAGRRARRTIRLALPLPRSGRQVRRDPPELMTRDNPMGLDPADPVSANDIVTRELHLVVNRPVRLRIRSKDVIHSFFVPHFRLKQDAVPGMTTEISFTPTGRASLKRPARSCAGSATTLCGEKSRSNRRRRLTRGSRNSNDRGCPYNGGGRPPSWCRAANCCFRGTTMLQRKVESRDFGTCSPEGPLSAPAPAPNAPP